VGAGYVKTHREIMEHAVFRDPWLFKVFLWCVMRANFRDTNTARGIVKRGSFTTGRIRAADELEMSPSRVYRLLHKLAEIGSITIEANSNWTTITVCNYSTYQADDQNPEQPADNERTADEQPADTRRRNQETKKPRNKTPPVSLEGCLKTSEQVHVGISPVWHQWLTYKYERGDKYTEAGLKAAVTHVNSRVAAYGTAAVADAILKAMANGWAGWDQNGTFDHKPGAAAPKPAAPPRKYLA
jgi:predicted transcriptional regulator